MTDLKSFRGKLALNCAAFDAVRENVRGGQTENDVKKIIQSAWDEAAGRCVPFSGDIVSGERSAGIDGDATDRILRRKDALILDLQPGFDSVFCDTTRTFFIGEIPEAAKKAYDAVLYALGETEKVLTAGVCACEIYERMQSALKEKGFTCPHHAGHAVGKEKLMEPEFLPDRTEKLTAGMTVALEPGIYTESFGIRIENNYLIREDGCENLFDYPLDAEYFIIGEEK